MTQQEIAQDKREEIWRETFFTAWTRQVITINGEPLSRAAAREANIALAEFDAAFPEYAPKKNETAND